MHRGTNEEAPVNDTLFSTLMANMGYDATYLREINEPSHEPLMDIDVLCEKLHEMHENGETLGIYPDIDTDGLTAGSLGLAGFAELGFDVRLYMPDAAKGHGVYPEDVEKFVEANPTMKAIITCDTGITSFDGVKKAHDLGLSIFVTDHHKEFPAEDGTRLPADVVINPMRIDETYAHPAICGAFVLYQILEEYARRYAPHKIESILLLRLYAGMGTVADVMPVLYENREIIRASVGLMRLFYQEPIEVYDEDAHESKKVVEDIDASLMMRIILSEDHHPLYVRAFRGVAAIVAVYTERGSVRSRESLDEEFTAYYVAPTINSIRRMGEDLIYGFSTFIGNDQTTYARYLLDINDRRKEEQKSCIEKLQTSIQPLAPYIYVIDGVRSGMLGLLANAMLNTSGQPTLVVSPRRDGSYGGSGRSPVWYPLNEKLNEFGFWAQGHEHAFGARFDTIEDLNQAYELISADSTNLANQLREAGETVDIPEADLILGDHPDAHAPLDDLEELLSLADQLNTLKPFGHGFRAPTIDIVTNAREISHRTMGKEKQHVSLSTPIGMKMVLWNNATTLPALAETVDEAHDEDEILVHCLGDVERNEWMGSVSANLICSAIYAEIKRHDGTTEKIVL